MREARIKIPVESGDAVYHCITRVVNGERLLDEPAREVLRKQLWQVAAFCGVRIHTYAILSNHFHVLLMVPQRTPRSDAELLRRYRRLYPSPTKFQAARLDVIEAELRSGGPEGDAWRKRQLALMGDVSQFMKLVKQRFSVWFNKSHRRYGTLWAERFKSLLVEPTGRAIETVAAYIDLNPVRAGLVDDPKDYRFCGYGEAVAGNPDAQRGLLSLRGETDWSAAQAGYRLALFGTAAAPRAHAASISPEALQQVVATGGKLPLTTLLRCRIRHFTDGAVLGSQAFVQQQLAAYRTLHHRRARTAVRPMPALTDWGGLATLRGLRRPALG